MSNMNFFCEPTMVIVQLPCLSSMANALSSTVVLANSEISDCVYSIKFAMCNFASKFFHIELVPWSDELRRI